jgi:hypothetical protein
MRVRVGLKMFLKLLFISDQKNPNNAVVLKSSRRLEDFVCSGLKVNLVGKTEPTIQKRRY